MKSVRVVATTTEKSFCCLPVKIPCPGKDKNWVSAISIPISQVTRARAAYEKRQADGDNYVMSVEDYISVLPSDAVYDDINIGTTGCFDPSAVGNCME